MRSGHAPRGTVAARAAGHELAVEWLPEGAVLARGRESGPHAPDGSEEALLAAVFDRRTDRGPLDATGLPASVPFALQRAALDAGADLHLVATEGDRRSLADLVARADRLLVRDGAIDEELAAWSRGAGDGRADGVPTSQTRGPAASYRAEFVQRDFSAGERTRPTMDRLGADAPLVAVLGTRGDRAADWLTGGQALGAVLLLAETYGAHASYLNQPCELPALREELRASLRMETAPQVVLRLGIGGDVPATPRRDATEARTSGGNR